MIVDCHTHLRLEDGEKAYADHLAATETVDVSIVLPGWGNDSAAVNEFVSKYVRAHRERTVGFALMDPTRDDLTPSVLTDRMRQWALQGIVLYCAAGGFHPQHSRAWRLYEVAQQQHWPIFFHNGDLEHTCQGNLTFAQPMWLDEIAQTFPELRMVIGSMGRPFLEQTLMVIGRHRHVYADLSVRPGNVWHIYNTVVAAYESGVMDKLLFGSAYPPGRAESCIETLLGFNMMLADTNLPTVPRGQLRNVVERPTLTVLDIDDQYIQAAEGRKTGSSKN